MSNCTYMTFDFQDFRSVSTEQLKSLRIKADAQYCLFVTPKVDPSTLTLEQVFDFVETMGADMAYSEYNGSSLCSYQGGSVRDDFDFGEVLIFNTASLLKALPLLVKVRKWGALYELRLHMSKICHFPQPTYSVKETCNQTQGHFDYVEARNREYQAEMEDIFTDYLKRVGAYLKPGEYKPIPEDADLYPVKASVIIPVRNRVRTIKDAIRSALSQKTDFPFNVIVVDNHSTDGTCEAIDSLSCDRLVHIIPFRTDLGIGGCWNEGVNSPFCGKYSVQLDSDDLYSDENSLSKIVEAFQGDRNAMVVGSYTVCDFHLKPLPPYLVDHREWSEENGRNNALRVNGFGAPRAFRTSLLRAEGFSNVSYGEDYQMCLRLSRSYPLARIWESLYLCRRWEGNTDAALPAIKQKENNEYKDLLRTEEILLRKRSDRK